MRVASAPAHAATVGANVPDQTQLSNLDRLTAAALTAILVLYIVLRLPMLAVPLERDEGEYAYMGQVILRGELPYVAAYNMKLPGVYYVYALILAVLGQSLGAIRFALIIITSLSTILVFRLGRRWLGTAGGLVAAMLFGILSLSTTMLGFTANAEHFVVLFALLGLSALDESTAPATPARLMLGSLALGVALLMKQHAVFFCGLGFIASLCWVGGHPRRLLIRAALLAVGLAAPYALTAGYFLSRGAFDRFWFWTVTYAREYTQQASLAVGLSDLQYTAAAIASSTWPILVLAGGGAVALFRQGEPPSARLAMGGLALAGLVATVPGLYFRAHYFLMAAPGVALLAALGLKHAGRWIAQRTGPWQSALTTGVLATAAALIPLGREFQILFRSPPDVSRSVYGVNPFPESLEVARVLAARTRPDEPIAVVGSEPQIYFYARRRAATPYIYMYPLVEPHHYARTMQQELIRDLETARPRYIVFVGTNFSWIKRPDSPTEIFDWLGHAIEQERYRIAGLIDTVPVADGTFDTEYLWDDSARSRTPRSPDYMIILERTSR